jgi:hypothetical protein
VEPSTLTQAEPRPAPSRPPIRFDRNELAGAFGDLGTDLPLLIGVIAASGVDSAGVLILFGLMQVFSGLWYRMPMPVQPLKAFAATGHRPENSWSDHFWRRAGHWGQHVFSVDNRAD